MGKQERKKTTPPVADPTTRRRRFLNGTMVAVAILCVLGIITGATVGIWFKKTFLANYEKTDYSGLSEAELRDNAEQITITEGYGQYTPTARSKKEDLIKSFIAAEYNGLQADNFYTFANSFVDMGITTQVSYSDRRFDGTTVVATSASKGMISFAEKMTYNLGDDNVTILRDSNVTEQKGDTLNCPFNCRFHNHPNQIITSSYSKASTTTKGYDDYVATTGTAPRGLITHIVSSKTVVNDPSTTFKTITLPSGETGYAFTLRLNPKTSVLNTVKQMKYLSNLDDYPTFRSVRLDVVLIKKNGQIYLKSIDSTEEYVVPYGMLAPQGTGYTHTEFTFNNVLTDEN